MRIASTTLATSFAAFFVFACGGGDAAPVGNNTPYTSDPNKTVIVGGGPGSGSVYETPAGKDCIQLPSGECVDPQKQCKEGERADVIVDSRGKVVAIVCYPADSAPPVVDSDGNVDLDKQNKGVVAVDGADDGIDIAGDVTAQGNNVTVYGQGPGVSVIGGKVEAGGNNFSMRGVTVKGDVNVTGNNATLVLCVVEGNVHIVGNNNVIADCSIAGDVQIDGVNNVLVANEVKGTIQISDAKNLVCDGNVTWNDANGNKVLDAGESGAALACSTR